MNFKVHFKKNNFEKKQIQILNQVKLIYIISRLVYKIV